MLPGAAFKEITRMKSVLTKKLLFQRTVIYPHLYVLVIVAEILAEEGNASYIVRRFLNLEAEAQIIL